MGWIRKPRQDERPVKRLVSPGRQVRFTNWLPPAEDEPEDAHAFPSDVGFLAAWRKRASREQTPPRW